jgi:EAL domain
MTTAPAADPFVMPMDSDPAAATLVRSVIDLARNLDLTVVAEGVEDQRTLDQLTAMDRHHIQGYHRSRHPRHRAHRVAHPTPPTRAPPAPPPNQRLTRLTLPPASPYLRDAARETQSSAIAQNLGGVPRFRRATQPDQPPEQYRCWHQLGWECIYPAQTCSDDLAAGLPDFSFEPPNARRATPDLVKSGDDWLGRRIPKVTASDDVQSWRLPVFITSEERSNASKHASTLPVATASRVTSSAAHTHRSTHQTSQTSPRIPREQPCTAVFSRILRNGPELHRCRSGAVFAGRGR